MKLNINYKIVVGVLAGLLFSVFFTNVAFAQNVSSLRFYGNDADGADRVTIPLSNDIQSAADVGGDFAIDFWIKANAADNLGTCTNNTAGWVFGNHIVNRSTNAVSGGSYGISLGDGKIAFALHNGSEGANICGGINVADGLWHHVAIERNATNGDIKLFINGVLDSQVRGPLGDISYFAGAKRLTNPNITIGAEMEDLAHETFPSFVGSIDEFRISNNLRFSAAAIATGSFTPGYPNYSTDENTMLLLRFNENAGNTIGDNSGNAINGSRITAGTPASPAWDTDYPQDSNAAIGSGGSAGSGSSGGGGGGGGGGGSAATGAVESGTRFPDVPTSNVFYPFIEDLASKNVVGGFSDGTFRPDNDVTRGQMSKFVFNGFGLSENTSCGDFPDVGPENVFYVYVTSLKCYGIIGGFSDGTYKPDAQLTRGQAMKFVVESGRFAKNDSNFLSASGVANPFPDLNSSNVFYEYILGGYSNGVVGGFSDGTFKEAETVSRGAMSKMVSNTIKL